MRELPDDVPSSPTRRKLLQAGALSALGLTLPQFLHARQTGPKAARSERSCIFIFQYGGLSQLDSWDPKPQAPTEVRGPYLPISTATPGFQVGDLMPRLARISDRYCVIRSMTHGVPVHDVANKMLLAGQAQPAPDAPAFGSVVSRLRPSTARVPSYVWLQKFGGGAAPPDPTYLTGGFLGMSHAPLLIGTGHEDNPATPGFRVKAFDVAEGSSLERLDSRRRLLAEMDREHQTASAGHPTLRTFQETAFELLHGSEARRAFDVEQEADTVRDRYGRHPLGQNLLMARRLIEAGVRLVSVVGWTGLAPGDKFMSLETWDMHGNAGIGIFEKGWNGLGWALPKADEAVSALLEDLDDRGLLDSTLVVLIGEFGRTPRISRGGSAIGRDHWPNCYSAMLAGAGIRGGHVYGASDSQAAYVKDRPVSLEDFTATLYHALEIDPQARLAPDGFTRPASTGEPLLDLF
ncbi:MAG TPA: DUF1501 domain-containing protein [Planctomycetaceae bacterium]|nr:DUF1501 domain-containing protein [Planctomycetaceae bacterium]